MSSSFFALYVIEELNGNNMQTGVIYSAIALMIFLVAPIWGKFEDRHNRDWHTLIAWLIGALLTGSLAQIIYSTADSLFIAICASILWGCSLGVLNTLPLSLLTKSQNSSGKSVAIGFGSSMNKCGNVLGIALGGLLFSQFGITQTFIVIAISYALIALVFYGFYGAVSK